MICIEIDELVPCLKDNITGESIDTEVKSIKRKSALAGLTSRNGWYTRWSELLDHNEIYALVIKGTNEIQGLIAIENRPDYHAVYISWAVAAPHNNPEISDSKRYSGVGGHLLAIAIERSEQLGYQGDITGFCRNEAILQHFVHNYGAIALRMLHDYQIGLFDESAERIREVYDYEWSKEEI